jgi:hypothetical protein
MLIGNEILIALNRVDTSAGGDPGAATGLMSQPLILLAGGVALIAGIFLVVFNMGRPWRENVQYSDDLE